MTNVMGTFYLILVLLRHGFVRYELFMLYCPFWNFFRYHVRPVDLYCSIAFNISRTQIFTTYSFPFCCCSLLFSKRPTSSNLPVRFSGTPNFFRVTIRQQEHKIKIRKRIKNCKLSVVKNCVREILKAILKKNKKDDKEVMFVKWNDNSLLVVGTNHHSINPLATEKRWSTTLKKEVIIPQ